MNEAGQLSFGVHQVALLARVTPRQLQWWDESRLISPEQSRHARHYSFNQVLAVMIVADLRRKGFSLHRCRTFINRINRELLRRRNGDYLVTDGKRLSFHEVDEVIEAAREATAGILVVSIADHVSSVEVYIARTSVPRAEFALRRAAGAGGRS